MILTVNLTFHFLEIILAALRRNRVQIESYYCRGKEIISDTNKGQEVGGEEVRTNSTADAEQTRINRISN